MKNFIIISLTALLAACASPEVDRAGMNFDQAKYETDLFECRVSKFLKAAVSVVGVGILGTFVGALHGWGQ